jgi:hypothetical protein
MSSPPQAGGSRYQAMPPPPKQARPARQTSIPTAPPTAAQQKAQQWKAIGAYADRLCTRDAWMYDGPAAYFPTNGKS